MALVLTVLVSGLLPATSAHANNRNPNGNNGTLKVHEKNTPVRTVNNDPKICVFNFEGFGFDVSQAGYIRITGQGKTDATYGNYSFGPTTASEKHRSYTETQYFNDANGPVIPNGHYKATLYGKDTGGTIDLKDVKAKSKVFKVECPAKPPVMPANKTPVSDNNGGSAVNDDDVDNGNVRGVSTVKPTGKTLSTSTQLPATLPETGGVNFSPLLILIASIAVYGAVYFAQGRRSFTDA